MLREDVVTCGLAVVFSFSQDAKNLLLFPGIISSNLYLVGLMKKTVLTTSRGTHVQLVL